MPRVILYEASATALANDECDLVMGIGHGAILALVHASNAEWKSLPIQRSRIQPFEPIYDSLPKRLTLQNMFKQLTMEALDPVTVWLHNTRTHELARFTEQSTAPVSRVAEAASAEPGDNMSIKIDETVFMSALTLCGSAMLPAIDELARRYPGEPWLITSIQTLPNPFEEMIRRVLPPTATWTIRSTLTL